MHTALLVFATILAWTRPITMIGAGLWMMVNARHGVNHARWFWPMIGIVLIVVGAHSFRH